MDIQRNVKIKSETADIERIGFLHSLKAKILLLVAAAVVLTVVLNLWTVIPKSSSNISELTSNYMLDVAMVAGEGIDNQIRMSSYDSVMSGWKSFKDCRKCRNKRCKRQLYIYCRR